MERCPGCNARLAKAIICPRCQADLSVLISTEQAAEIWLSKAIKYWGEGETEQCLRALELSLNLKKNALSVIFREFLIEQTCQEILELLTQKQFDSAKQQLYKTRKLHPNSNALRELQSFTDYLCVRSQILLEMHQNKYTLQAKRILGALGTRANKS